MSNKTKKPKKPSKNTKTNTMTRDIYKVLWKDHFSGNYSWTHLEDISHTPLVNVTVGILVHEDKDVLTLMQNMCSAHRGSDSTTILKNCIVKQTKLGEVEFGKA